MKMNIEEYSKDYWIPELQRTVTVNRGQIIDATSAVGLGLIKWYPEDVSDDSGNGKLSSLVNMSSTAAQIDSAIKNLIFKNSKEEIKVDSSICTVSFPTTKPTSQTKYYGMRSNQSSFQLSGYLDKAFVAPSGTDSSDWLNLNNTNSLSSGNLGGTRNAVNGCITFMTDSISIVLKTYYAPPFLIAIDDVLYSDSTTLQGVTSTDAGPSGWVLITFPTQKIRKVEIRWSATSFSFGGVYILPARKLWNPNIYSPRVAYVGDSLSTGTSSNIPGSTYTDRIDQYCGFKTSNVNGWGGTGFINKVQGTSLNYLERFSDTIAFNPDILIVQCSVNDNTKSASDITTAVTTYLNNALSFKPNLTIIILGVCGRANAGAISNETAVLAAVTALNKSNIYFIPSATASDPLISGTGNVGNIKNDGNADWVIASDGTHFTAEGFIYYAKRMSNEIKRIFI